MAVDKTQTGTPGLILVSALLDRPKCLLGTVLKLSPDLVEHPEENRFETGTCAFRFTPPLSC